MIRLQTLGRLDLRGPGGQEISSVLVHPKRTALLVYLAVAAPDALHRRDSLVALFWPELDQERARAALRKALHYLRRSLGEEAIVGRGDEEVGVSLEQVRCDAHALIGALDAGDPEQAFELYGGPFLDGFFVDGAPEFEHWADRERERLRQAAFASAWAAAERHEEEGDAFGAAMWARRAAALVPEDEAALRRLIRLLARLGDRAGAVAAYEDFAGRLADVFDIQPSAETQLLVKEIRSSDEQSPNGGAAVTPPREGGAGLAIEELGAADRAGRSRRRGAMLVAVVLVIAATWMTLDHRRSRAPPPDAPTTVAVLPFEIRAGSDLAYLREGMVDLLSAKLDGLGGLRSVDPRTVLGSISRESATIGTEPATGLKVAERVGAGLYVVGAVVEAGGEVQISAVMFERGTPDEAASRAAVEGTAEEIFTLVDRLTTALLVDRLGGAAVDLERTAAQTTGSLAALKAYLDGERQFRAVQMDSAIESFQRAVDRDSTFALAWYRLSTAAAYADRRDLARSAAERAHGRRDRLPGRARALLDAWWLRLTGAISRAEHRYRTIVTERPDDVEAWYQLGELLLAANALRGRPPGEAREPFLRAVALDPTHGCALCGLYALATMERDFEGSDSLFSRAHLGRDTVVQIRALRVIMSGEPSDAILEELRRAPEPAIYVVVAELIGHFDVAAGREIAELLAEPGRPPGWQAVGHLAVAHTLAAQGRPAEARARLLAAEHLDAARSIEARAWLGALPFLPAEPAELEDDRTALLRMDPAAVPPSPPGQPEIAAHDDLHAGLRAYLIGLLSVRLGDLAAAERQADELARGAAASEAAGEPIDRTALLRCFEASVHAHIALARSDSVAALEAFERAPLETLANSASWTSPIRAQVLERYRRAELLRALGREREALGWYASLQQASHWDLVFDAPSHLRQAELLARAGRAREAAEHYTRFLRIWREPESGLRAVAETAKRQLSSLRF